MLFISNQTLLSSLFLLFISYTLYITASNYYWGHSISSSIFKKIPCNFVVFQTFFQNYCFVWSPLFKRSSYIGLVWKSNWKL